MLAPSTGAAKSVEGGEMAPRRQVKYNKVGASLLDAAAFPHKGEISIRAPGGWARKAAFPLPMIIGRGHGRAPGYRSSRRSSARGGPLAAGCGARYGDRAGARYACRWTGEAAAAS